MSAAAATSGGAGAAVLEARGVAKRYRDTDALRDASLVARAGEIVVVLGASGSGKTTLLRLLHLLEAPSRGGILLDGTPAPTTVDARLATIRRMSLVQQRPGLLRAPAWENVAFPLRARGVPHRERRERAVDWLGRLGLGGRVDAPAASLSGGEAQRVGLARALVTRPDILLLDEATNQLDPASVRLVETLLREETARGCAIVAVTHNVAQARRLADRIMFLEDGTTLAAGHASEMLTRPGNARLREFLDYG